MRRKNILTLLLLILANLAYGTELDPIMRFKTAVDGFDNPYYEKDMEYAQIPGWWKIADKLVISLLNDVIKGNSASSIFKNAPITIQEGLVIYTPSKNNIGLSYTKWCNPQHAPYDFNIKVISLTNDNSVYYNKYTRGWFNPPGCDGEEIHAGTFSIVQRNSNGKYKITARFEESNFYREMVLTGKLNDMVVIDRNNYGWSGALETEFDPITEANGEIRFNTKLKVCDPGGPCYHKMYLYWVYGKDKKLRCLYYLDRYELVNDPETGILKPVGQKVELAQ